jgi:hypothetical protein
LALATIQPAPATAAEAGPLDGSNGASHINGANGQPETILQLITDHKAADAATDKAMRHYGDMEEAIPEEQRAGYLCGREVTEVSTDDPRWTAACYRFNDTFSKTDDIALAMLDTPIASVEGLAALMAYAGEKAELGYMWPEEIVDETFDGQPRNWERWVLVKAAATMRQPNAVAA